MNNLLQGKKKQGFTIHQLFYKSACVHGFTSEWVEARPSQFTLWFHWELSYSNLVSTYHGIRAHTQRWHMEKHPKVPRCTTGIHKTRLVDMRTSQNTLVHTKHMFLQKKTVRSKKWLQSSPANICQTPAKSRKDNYVLQTFKRYPTAKWP